MGPSQSLGPRDHKPLLSWFPHLRALSPSLLFYFLSILRGSCRISPVSPPDLSLLPQPC